MTAGAQHAHSLGEMSSPTPGYRPGHRRPSRLKRLLRSDEPVRDEASPLLHTWAVTEDRVTIGVNAALEVILVTDAEITGVPEPHGFISLLRDAIGYSFAAEATTARLLA